MSDQGMSERLPRPLGTEGGCQVGARPSTDCDEQVVEQPPPREKGSV
mgnify:CR=1 FL=1